MNTRLLFALGCLGALLGAVPESHAATAEDFGFDTLGSHPHPNRPLLVLVAQFTSTPARMSGGITFQAVTRNSLARTRSQFDTFVFDFVNAPPNSAVFSGQTLNAAFLEMSAGNFLWTRAASFAQRNFSQPETQVLEELSEPFGPSPGRAYGIESTVGLNYIVGRFLSDNPSFDLAPFDTNGDAIVSAEELTILLISNYRERLGANRTLNLAGLPNSADPSRPITLRGRMAWCDHRTSFATWVHELSHSLETFDLYNGTQVAASGTNSNFYGSFSTLMGGTLDTGNNDNPATWHLDPWHKMKLGWLRPRLVPMSQGGGFPLRCAQSPGADGPLLLYDDTLPPDRIGREFYMIEYRNPMPPVGSRYDRNVAGTGIIIWHIGTDANHNPYRLPDPTNPPMNPNGPVSVIVEGRNPTNNGTSRGGDNTAPATQVWTTNRFTQIPTLRRFDGSATSFSMQARTGPDANAIYLEVIRSADTWAHFRELPPGVPENGTVDSPWNTLGEAYAASPWGGTIRIKPGQTLEVGTFNKRTVITAEGGSVTIGKQ